MKEETEIDLYAAGNRREFDASCKRLFQNREIIAPILREIVPEYRDCTLEEIIKYIEADSIGDMPVDDVPARMEGMPTELSSVSEKLIR